MTLKELIEVSDGKNIRIMLNVYDDVYKNDKFRDVKYMLDTKRLKYVEASQVKVVSILIDKNHNLNVECNVGASNTWGDIRSDFYNHIN